MSLVLDGTNGVTFPSGAQSNGIVSGTAVASTSGTSIDFTSIPSWVKRITVMFSGVSTTGTSTMQVQLGAGSVTTTGYLGSMCYISATSVSQGLISTGFGVVYAPAAAYAWNGFATFTLLGSNTWCASSNMSIGASASQMNLASGSIPLSGTLDRIRITTVNGTDTFDAGSINILYE